MLFKGKGYIMHEGKVHEFVDGVLEIEDKALIEKMKKYYEYEEEKEEDKKVLDDCKDGFCEVEYFADKLVDRLNEKNEVDYESMSNAELKRMLDEKEINYNNKANKSDLIKLIVGVD